LSSKYKATSELTKNCSLLSTRT